MQNKAVLVRYAFRGGVTVNPAILTKKIEKLLVVLRLHASY